jgi:hypothetical protein
MSDRGIELNFDEFAGGVMVTATFHRTPDFYTALSQQCRPMSLQSHGKELLKSAALLFELRGAPGTTD